MSSHQGRAWKENVQGKTSLHPACFWGDGSTSCGSIGCKSGSSAQDGPRQRRSRVSARKSGLRQHGLNLKYAHTDYGARCNKRSGKQIPVLGQASVPNGVTEVGRVGLADIGQVCRHQHGINGMDQAIASGNIGLHDICVIDPNAVAAIDGHRMPFQGWAGR